MATLIAIASIVVFLWFVSRKLLTRWQQGRLESQASRVSNLLNSARKEQYKDLDKLLFDMRDTYDITVIEEQLRQHFEQSDAKQSQELIRGFSLIGLTERYIERVRSAPSWRDRTKAASVLGEIGDTRAVLPLLEVMREPREDNDVKLACAEALGRLNDPSVIPILCQELGRLDEWSSPRIAAVLVAFGRAAIPHLLTTLDSSATLNGRIWAAQVLGKLKARRAVPPLMNRLHDRSEQMRLSAANALGDIGDLRAVRPLVDIILRDPTPAVRAQGASALGRLGDPEVLPILVGALGDPEYWMRFRALEAIEVLNPEDTSPLESALDDTNPEVRRRAALALERLGRLEESFEALSSTEEAEVATAMARLVAVGRAGLSERFIRHLDDEEPGIRLNIVRILGQVGAAQHGPELIPVLHDESLDMRMAAIDALGRLGTPNTGQALVDLFADNDRTLQQRAAAALSQYPQKQLQALVPNITEFLDQESDESRLAAATVLANINGQEIDELLLTRILHDRFVEVRILAVKSLGERRMQDAVEAIGTCLNDAHGPLRVAASNALGNIGGERAIRLLLSAMSNADHEQRDAICRSIATIGFVDIGPALDVLLGSTDLNARLGAVWTLGKISDERAVPLLAQLLHESEPKVRSSSAGALGKIPCRESITALATAMNDPNQFVRAAVINALGKIGQPEDATKLQQGLEDPDPFVRHRAVVAIGQIGGDLAYNMLTTLGKDAVDAPHMVIALGLCGVPHAIGAAVSLLQNRTAREYASKLLQDEDEVLQRRFLASVRLDSKRPIGGISELDFFSHLEPDALAQRFLDTLRNDQDSFERQRAVAALAQVDTSMAIEALASALRHDPDRHVRLSVAKSLTQRGDSAHVRTVLGQAVLDPYPEVRVAAIGSLGEVGHPQDAKPVLASLGASETEVVQAAQSALTKIYGDNIAHFLDWLMGESSSPRFMIAGLQVVANIADDRSLGVLLHLVSAGDPQIRREAVTALAALRHPDAIQKLLDALTDPVERVRAAIVSALSTYPRAEVFDRFQDTVLDPSVLVRSTLATSLAKMESTRSIELLDKLSHDQHPEVCSAATLGFLDCPDQEGKSHFLDRWEQLGERMRTVIRQSESGQADALFDIAKTAGEPKLRGDCIKVLSALGPRLHAAKIAVGLTDPHPDVRIAAIEGLSPLAKERLEDWLQPVMDDPVAAVRAAARRQLIRSV